MIDLRDNHGGFVKRDPGETVLKKDSQLDTAVAELLKQMK